MNFLAYVRGNELTEWERELNVEWEFVIIRNILERFFGFPIGSIIIIYLVLIVDGLEFYFNRITRGCSPNELKSILVDSSERIS